MNKSKFLIIIGIKMKKQKKKKKRCDKLGDQFRSSLNRAKTQENIV